MIGTNVLLDVAVGKSRLDTRWRNTKMTWADLVRRLSVTHRTAESVAEYKAAAKSRQAEIKDVGGFVGGFLDGGRKLTSAVRHRQVLTLDADFASAELWSEAVALMDCAMCTYSTHNHSPEAPRLRLLIPLDRPVSPEEYMAISRKVAATIGIEAFDPTTHQAARLMYWPSTSRDGQYLFEVAEGDLLSADEVLGRYTDWRDSSSWPVSEREGVVVARAVKKAGDPLEKGGLIGVFCRVYGIEEAITKYLGDVYEPCEGVMGSASNGLGARYTYSGGTTASGLVVYDDKFAYSHHGSDPTCGRLCNAFDLVRLHKFGYMGDDGAKGTGSYGAMCELAGSDVAVRSASSTERISAAQADFALAAEQMGGGNGVVSGGKDHGLVGGKDHGVVGGGNGALGGGGDGMEDDGDEADGDVVARKLSDLVAQAGKGSAEAAWLSRLAVDAKGAVKATIANIKLIIESDPNLTGAFVSDLFRREELVVRRVPWRTPGRGSQYLTDVDVMGLRNYLERVYGLSSPGKTDDALGLVLLDGGFHPVRDYLTGLGAWDGVERLGGLLVEYLGAEDSEYVRTVTRKVMVAAVARVMNPGVKFDYVLTLVGAQGVGKSTLISKLGRDWYCENLTTVVGKEAAEQLGGVWLMEMGELASLKKAELEIIKNFISRQTDSFRPAYGKKKVTYPRQCVFIGTTNNEEFLRDHTGNRRFWPVVVGLQEPVASVHKGLEGLAVDRLWAEAMWYYKQGEALYLDREMEQSARVSQEYHFELDERAGLIAQYLDLGLPVGWTDMDLHARRAYIIGDELRRGGGSGGDGGDGLVQRDVVCAAEIWCELLGGDLKGMNTQTTRAVHNIMSRMLGWEKHRGTRKFGSYGYQRCYIRTNSKANKKKRKT